MARILLSHKKARNLAICDNMHDCGYYAKWNKSKRQRQILYNFSDMVETKNENKWSDKIETQLQIQRIGKMLPEMMWVGDKKNKWKRLRGTDF